MSNHDMIVIIVSLLVITITSFVFAYVLLVNKIKKRNKNAIFLIKKSVGRDKLYTLYLYLYQNPLTRKQVKKIKSRYDLIYVGDDKKAAKETVKISIILFVSYMLIGIFVLANHVGLYGIALIFLMQFVLSHEIIDSFIEKQDIRLLRYLERYISDLRKYYFRYNMIEIAISEANSVAKNEMRLHGEKIYNILTSDEKDEDILMYNEQIQNRFLRILLAVCSTAIDFGDKKMPNDETVFLFNLKELGKEITIEKLKKQKKRYVYMGTTSLTILPIFSIPFIENWAIGNIENLYTWYHGIAGITVLTMLFILTLSIYNVLKMMRDTADIDDTEHVVLEFLTKVPFLKDTLNNLYQRNYGKTLKLKDMLKHSGSNITTKEFYVKQMLTGIAFMIIGFIVICTAHNSVKNVQLNYVENISTLSSSASDKEDNEIKRLVTKYTYLYKDNRDIRMMRTTLVSEMKKDNKVIKNEYIFELLADEITTRIITYQNQYIKSYEVLLIFVFGILGYVVPKIRIFLKEKFVYMQMEDEVIQFQSIILMLIYLDRISAKTVLSWLENFATIFKESIQTCLSDFSAGEMEALERLKDEEPFDPFVRIVENLQQADRVGIKRAFNEIAVDRQNYQEKRKQENEISLQNRGVIASYIALVPVGSVILFYLIVPFITSGLRSLTHFTNMQ